MPKRAKTKVVYKRLRNYWGYALIDENKIELCQGLRGKKHLEILLHEKVHLFFPDLEERAVLRIGKDMSELLWKEGYRQLKKKG